MQFPAVSFNAHVFRSARLLGDWEGKEVNGQIRWSLLVGLTVFLRGGRKMFPSVLG